MDSRVLEGIKENKDDLFKIVDYTTNFGITKLEDIETLYLSKKFKNATVLKTYNEWNKLGYRINYKEHGVKLYKNNNVKNTYFDISQVYSYNNTGKDIEKVFLKDATVLMENQGDTLLYDNYIKFLRKDIKGDFPDNEKIVMENLITHAICKRYDYFNKSQILTENSDKEFNFAYMKECKSKFLENNEDFTRMIEEILRLTYEKMVIIHKEAIKLNILENRTLDKSKNLYYTTNNNKSQDTISMNVRKEGDIYGDNERTSNENGYRPDGETIQGTGRYETGRNEKENMAHDGQVPSSERNSGILEGSEQLLPNDRDIQDASGEDIQFLQYPLYGDNGDKDESGYRYMGEGDGLSREADINTGRDNSSINDNSLFDTNKNREGTKEDTGNPINEGRNNDEFIEGGEPRATNEQVENVRTLSRDIQEEYRNGIYTESEKTGGSEQSSKNESERDNKREPNTGNNEYGNINNEVGDKTPIFIDNKNIKINEDNFYQINKENSNGLALGLDKDKLIKFLLENEEVMKANRNVNYKEQTVVCHLFNPYGAGDWLITDFEKYDDDIILHGWANLGNDLDAEFGDVSLNELININKNLPIEIETHTFDFGNRFCDIIKNNERSYGLDRFLDIKDIENITNDSKYNFDLKNEYDTCLKRCKTQIEAILNNHNNNFDDAKNDIKEAIDYYKNRLIDSSDTEKLEKALNNHIDKVKKNNDTEKLVNDYANTEVINENGVKHINYAERNKIASEITHNIEKEIENAEKEVEKLEKVANKSDDDLQNYTDALNKWDNIRQKKELLNYDFVNDDISLDNSFNLKEKFDNNINAIKTLKLIESENRLATKDEQLILSKYVGWGGLANYAFDEYRSSKDNYNLVKELLTDEEYRDAKQSVRSAYFTPDYVVKAIYEKLEDFEFKGGKILEPSCGTGKFLSNMPNEIRENSEIVGIEKDSISARISKLLYPSMTIKCKGFEKEKIKNNTYNLVIGNIPFGDTKLHDTEYAKDNLLIHDYFINKSLDKLADGGICVIITSTGTMDKKDDKARSLFSEKANFLGSIRLPSGTFGDTKAASDILFFQKDTKNKLGLNQEFVKADSYFNPTVDRIEKNYENTYKNTITNETYNFDRYVNIEDYISMDMWKDLFVGIKQTTDEDIDEFSEYDYENSRFIADISKLEELKVKYEEWVKNGKDINNKPYDATKDFYIFPRYVDLDEIKELKEYSEYKISVGKENPNYYTYDVNDKGKIKQNINEDAEKYTYNDEPDIHIETSTDIIDNNEYSKKFFDININKYYKNNPNKIIGSLSTDTGQFGRAIILSKMNDVNNIKDAIYDKLKDIKCEYKEIEEVVVNEKENEKTYIPNSEYETNKLYELKRYSHFVYNDKVCFKENDEAYYVDNLSTKEEGILRALIKLKDTTHNILQLEEKNQIEEADKLRNELLDTYNNFYDKYKIRINDKDIRKLLSSDDDKGLLLSLEVGNDEQIETFKIKKKALKKDISEYDAIENKTLSNGIEANVILDNDGNEHYYDNDGNEYISKIDTEYEFENLAQIFTERVIKNQPELKNVDNAKDGMIASLQTLGKIDINFIEEKTGINKDTILNDLKGQVYYDFNEKDYVSRDEFLSGNILQKIEYHENYIKELNNEKSELNNSLSIAEKDENSDQIKDISSKISDITNNILEAESNIKDLKEVIPEKIPFEDIDINLGSTWLPLKYYNQFIEDVFDYRVQKNSYSTYGCKLIFKEKLSPPEYFIESKGYAENDNTELLYGTEDKKSLEILESALNLRPIQVSDRIRDENGQYKYIVNPTKTALANEKAEAIKRAFKDWKINKLSDEAKKDIEDLYNRKYNCMVSRKFDGNILDFPLMNTNITLNEHQKNGIARMVFGRNTGLAHCVGSGKTYEIVAGIMKFKQLGLSNKSMIVVPKPIIEQWQREFLNLYPTANIIAPSEKDFTKENRMKFLNKIATGNYDAIILSQEQFQKIPLSKDRQERYINKQIDEYEDYLSELKSESDSQDYRKMQSTVKSIQKQIDSLKQRLEVLKNEDYKDNVVNFEELGIDKLFVDEAHYYKNAFYPTKLTRVAGIQSSDTKRTFDLQMKCRYLNDKTDYKGVYLATGTPITNSIVELYTMMKYLQEDKLKEVGLYNLDDFVANFCEIKTQYELDATGSNYHQKTRINSFNNAPELIRLFKESWDIVNREDLKNIKLPKKKSIPVELNATEVQKQLMESFKERCERMEHGGVDPKDDNKLLLTNHGKLSAIDPRLYDEMLPDEMGTKTNACIDKVAEIYFRTIDEKGTQMIFSDMGVPKQGKTFDIYNDIKKKLIDKGIKKEEIAFIGDFDTPEKKRQMQKMMQEGKIRVLLSSTDKGGTGLNVQNKMKALHHISLPWKPSDITQREGRIERQGNMYDEIEIYTYVAKDTFDARTFEILQNKDYFQKQIMKGDTSVRRYGEEYFKSEDNVSYEDFVEMSLPDSNIKKIKELERQVKLLEAEENQFNTRTRTNKQKLIDLPKEIEEAKHIKELVVKDIDNVSKMDFDNDPFKIKIFGVNIGDVKEYNDKQIAQDILYNRMFKDDKNIFFRTSTLTKVAEYKGFDINVSYDMISKCFYMRAKSKETGYMYANIDLGNSAMGNMTRIDNFIKSLDENRKQQHETKINHMELELENLNKSLKQTFNKSKELEDKRKELAKLRAENDLKRTENNTQNNENNQQMKMQ